MKHLLTAFVFAFGMAVCAPTVQADCGSCGGDAKAESHEGHDHGEAKCAGCDKAGCEGCDKADCDGKCEGCDKAKADCDCQKKDDALCKCGKTKAECECKKGEGDKAAE